MRSFLFSKDKLNELYQTKRIVVASGCSGSGVSFISEIIASGLTKLGSVSLTELGKPHFYEALGFDKRFLESGYNDFIERVRLGEHISPTKKNIFKKINWIVNEPIEKNDSGGDLQSKPLNMAELFRLFYLPKEEYSIFDCSALPPDMSLQILAEADYPVIVIDPLPSKLAESRRFLEKVRIKLPNAVFTVNKINSGVHVSELVHFLGTKDFFSIPAVPIDLIYKAEYNSLPVSELKEAAPYLDKAQDMLSKLFQ